MIEVRLLGARSVERDGHQIEAVTAQPKLLAFLAYLLIAGAEGDGFVSRDELAARFWPESDPDHARNTLNQYIHRLREALGADAVPGHGRVRIGIDPALVRSDVVGFLAAAELGDVSAARALYGGELLPDLALTGDPELESWLADRRQGLERRRREIDEGPAAADASRARPERERRIGRLAPGAAVAAAVVIGAWWTMTPRERMPDPVPRVAVLPFLSQLPDPADAYLTNGLHAAVMTETGREDDLVVIAGSSVGRYREPERSLPEIADALYVEAILEASLDADGDSLQLSARLVEPSTGQELWSGTYRDARTGSSWLPVGVPREIAAQVRAALRDGGGAAASAPHVPPPEAAEAFLRARATDGWTNPDEEIGHLERAVEIDPLYAEAWAELARAWAFRGSWFGDLSPAEAMPKAENAAQEALAVDSLLAEAHLARGMIAYLYTWEWAEAEEAFRRSTELNPNLVLAHAFYGNLMRAMRRVEEGVVHLERATEISPLDAGAWAELGVMYRHLARFDEAGAASRRSRELDPEGPAASFSYAMQLFGEGRHREAAETVEAGGILGPASVMYAHAGLEDDARRLLAVLEADPNRSHLFIASTYVILGDREKALEWLKRGIDERHSNMVWLNFQAYGTDDGYEPLAPGWPEFDMRDEPRYLALLERMNFPEPPPRP